MPAQPMIKLRNSRGENCVEDNCNATTARPSSSAMTVTIVLLIPISNDRASSAVPWNANGELLPTSTRDSSAPSRIDTPTDTTGSNDSDPRLYSHNASRRIMAIPPTAHASDRRLASGSDCRKRGRCGVS